MSTHISKIVKAVLRNAGQAAVNAGKLTKASAKVVKEGTSKIKSK